MDTASLRKQINQEIEDFRRKDITIVPGFGYNQYQTLEQIIFYWNSKYKSGAVDDEGDRKYFRNISRNPAKVCTKAIDFDTKNIRLLTTGGGDPLKTWFMERDLKFWMRDRDFGRTLNRIFEELPVYGSVVLKIVDGTPYFVDLRNFILEQSADTLDDTNYIIEVHHMTPAQLRRAAKDLGWDSAKVDKTIEEFRKAQGKYSHIRVYERYGEIEVTDAKGNKTYPSKKIYVADVGEDEYDQRGEVTFEHPGIILSEQEYEGHPYWEFHMGKVPGRWLGVGVVEELFEPQIAINQNTNLQNKSAVFAATRLWQTRDPNGGNRNLLTDVRNGEVLHIDSEITQVNMEDRNVPFFTDQDQKWLRTRDELTFSYDVVQGERLPAGTPLGSAQLAITQTLSYFEGIQENVALAVKKMLYDVILPQFEKEQGGEHTLRLVGKDLDEYAQMINNDLTLKEVIRLALLGRFPTEAEKEAISLSITEAIKQGKEKILDVPKGFYKDLEYDIDIDITGESVDTRVQNATLFAILQAITADPTMTQDPTKKNILFFMAEKGGINPHDIFGAETKSVEDVMMAQGRAGGGVSAPALNASAMEPLQQTL